MTRFYGIVGCLHTGVGQAHQELQPGRFAFDSSRSHSAFIYAMLFALFGFVAFYRSHIGLASFPGYPPAKARPTGSCTCIPENCTRSRLKLAEALAERSDCQNRIAEMNKRLPRSARRRASGLPKILSCCWPNLTSVPGC